MYHEGKALRSRTGAAKTWDHGCLVCVCVYVFCSLTSWCLHPYRYLDKQKSSTSISWCLCDNFIWFSLDSISINIFQCCQASASEAEAKEDGNSRDENAKASARSTVYFLYLKTFLSSLSFNKWKMGGHQKNWCRVASGASTVKPSQHRVQRDSEIGWSCQRVRLSNEFGASIQTESWDYFPTTRFQCFAYVFYRMHGLPIISANKHGMAWVANVCLEDKHGRNVKDCLDWKCMLPLGSKQITSSIVETDKV